MINEKSREDENGYWVVICYLSFDQTLDCVESEWPEIKTFQAFLSHDKNCHRRQTCLVIVLQAQGRLAIVVAGWISQVVPRVRFGLVETILADLKFVPRSKTQQHRLPPGKALLTANHYFSPSTFQHSFQTFINRRLIIMIIHITLEYNHEEICESLETFTLSFFNPPTDPISWLGHPSKVHAGARIPSELYSHQRYFWKGIKDVAPKLGIISYESLFLNLIPIVRH